ncbi:LysR family transcriptional regulator [Gynuella sunshinyii]|uniref:HTH-type transcriptional regulator MetR n=1 Tax=Gynuella sunshinyii YC6258 TaxID=1445510 RepID=A0A0C5W1R2_9GAMM|nr:LysR family transcriptional regulator [Gynuella sunshinyii]AJQ96619.1 transcriptional regulator [Gynuella sunshinyii YC6258]
MDIKHLKTLRAIRDTGSLVEAAERIYLTQSAVSHQVRELENRLNTAILNRKSRPVSFTPAGQKLLALADEILPRISNTLDEIQQMVGGTAGRLHIAIECHSCFQWLIPSINQYRESWPEVELDFSSGFNFEPLPALQQGLLDLVVTSDPIPLEGVSYEPLFQYESKLAVSIRHPLANQSQVWPEQLVDETLITYPVEKGRLDIYREFLLPAGIKPRATRTAELTVMMIQLVASGRGVCCLPNWALAEYLHKDLIHALGLGDGVWATLYAAVRTEQLSSSYVQDFISSARENCMENLEGIVIQET